jgi:hypothetical protein
VDGLLEYWVAFGSNGTLSLWDYTIGLSHVHCLWFTSYLSFPGRTHEPNGEHHTHRSRPRRLPQQSGQARLSKCVVSTTLLVTHLLSTSLPTILQGLLRHAEPACQEPLARCNATCWHLTPPCP